MFTLIRIRPIFRNSGSSDFWMFSRNFSRSRLMSSMHIEAITWRSWPKIMSSACFWISLRFRPKRRMAAFCINSGVVPMATVKTLGTLTRMFSAESAPRKGISICIGSRCSQS